MRSCKRPARLAAPSASASSSRTDCMCQEVGVVHNGLNQKDTRLKAAHGIYVQSKHEDNLSVLHHWKLASSNNSPHSSPSVQYHYDLHQHLHPDTYRQRDYAPYQTHIRTRHHTHQYTYMLAALVKPTTQAPIWYQHRRTTTQQLRRQHFR